MEYTIKELADLAGVSTRTLRYYDQIGLLAPARISEAGYRIYGAREVDALQQILLYKAMGMELAQIKENLHAPDFDQLQTMENQLANLLTKKQQLEIMIDHVSKTILREKGLITMTDQEKFEGLKQTKIADNEETYGSEVRQRYGDAAVDGSNRKMLELSQEEYQEMERIDEEIKKRLQEAVKGGKLPMGPEGKEIAQLHKKWLSCSWTAYSREAHLGVVEMYTADERFQNYYDRDVQGCAAFLKEAVKENM